MGVPGVFTPSKGRLAPPGDASPVVSVVMSTWNDTRFMRETVDGILAQTFADMATMTAQP